MKDNGLLKRVNALGLPFLGVEETQDVNTTLADMVKSGEPRLWEGFPVALANSAKQGLFSYEEVRRRLKKTSDRSALEALMSVSLALYEFFNLKFVWTGELYNFFPAKRKKDCKRFLAALKDSRVLKVEGRQMPAERLKTVFNNYFNQTQAQLNELLSVKDELSLEYALSQVFSPKQKELFLKKLKREKLTKTEKEYFSRAVKKKVLALANSQLHQLSQKLLS